MPPLKPSADPKRRRRQWLDPAAAADHLREHVGPRAQELLDACARTAETPRDERAWNVAMAAVLWSRRHRHRLTGTLRELGSSGVTATRARAHVGAIFLPPTVSIVLVATRADVDPKTAGRVLRGEPVRPRSFRRVALALRRLRLPPPPSPPAAPPPPEEPHR